MDENGRLTNAGALIADESPIRQSRVFCTRWNGLDKASGIIDAIDDNEFSGGLINLLQDGMDFVMHNSSKAWRKTPDGREEFPEYPERAVQEGIVNALIHRNYLELGSEVHIDMFDDRIEIYSPGGMISGIPLTRDNILAIPSKRRNPVIADIFSRLKYMERRGSGFKKIIGDYEKQPNFTKDKEPVFNDSYDSFVLTIYNLNYGNVPQDVPQDVPQGYDIGLQIKQLIQKDNKITRKRIAEILGISEKTVGRKIKDMNDVHYIGRGYSGHWEIGREDND